MFANIINKIKARNNLWITAGPFVICACFLIAFLPNIFGKLGINVSQILLILFRAIGSSIFVAYTLLVLVSSGQIKNNKRIIIFFFSIFIFVLVIPLFRFGTLLKYQYIEPYYYKNYHVTFNFGFSDILTYYVTAAFNVFFAFSLFTILKDNYKKSKYYLLPFYLFIGVILVSVVYSLLTEGKYYILFLKGNDTLKISSLFPSKNAFGLFLFQAFVIDIFLFSEIRKRIRYLFIPVAVLFFVITFFSGCKTALFADIIFVLFGLNHYVFANKKVKKFTSISIIVLCSSFICFFILFFAVPSFHQSGILKSLYYQIAVLVSILHILIILQPRVSSLVILTKQKRTFIIGQVKQQFLPKSKTCITAFYKY